MAATISHSYPIDPICKETQVPPEFEYLRNGGIRRPYWQSGATDARYKFNNVDLVGNGGNPTPANKSGEYSIEFESSNIEGLLEDLFLAINVAASASADGYLNMMATDIYYECTGVQPTGTQDAICTAFDNTVMWSDEDSKSTAEAIGFSASTLFAKSNITTTAKTIYINVMNPFLRAWKPYLKYMAPGFKLRLKFKLNNINSYLAQDTTTAQTLTFNKIQALAIVRIPGAVEEEQWKNIYKAGFEATFIEYQTRRDVVLSGTTELEKQLDLTGYMAGLLIACTDVSADVNDAALDFSDYTKYRIADANGNTLFFKTGAEYIDKGLQSIITSMSVPGTLLSAKNLILAQTGCQFNVFNDIIKYGAFKGGHNFQWNDKIFMNCSDSNADKMYYWPLRYRKFTLVYDVPRGGSMFKNIENVDDKYNIISK